MTFKAIIFDLDGTAIPNKADGMPSQRVIKAVLKAQKIIKVIIATGRLVADCKNILKALKINSPSVVAGGTQILDPKTEKTLWKKELTQKQIGEILKISLPYDYRIILGNELKYIRADESKASKSWQIVYIMYVKPRQCPQIIQRLSQVPDIAIYEVKSHKVGHIDIHITHAQATKKNSLEKVLKMMQIKKNDVIGVGDSNNDKPIFEVSGYKVAMGNGSEELKAMADYIAPSVKEDGLAETIEKLILEE